MRLQTKAYQLAATAHRDQLDKVGVPYIEHALAVGDLARRFAMDQRLGADNGVQAFAVGVLHDVLEDTDTPLRRLSDVLPPVVTTGVVAMTHFGTESYEAYLERVAGHRLAAIAKVADLVHNADPDRGQAWALRDPEAFERYRAKRGPRLEAFRAALEAHGQMEALAALSEVGGRLRAS